MLTTAIDSVFRGRLELAERELERANALSPNYFEVHRVQAFIAINQEDFFGAESAFVAAISLAPERAPLRLWYGGFLSRSLGDSDRAVEQYFEAERLAPTASIVKLECARVLQYLRRFDEAAARLVAIEDIQQLSSRTRRVHLDLILQNNVRKSEYLSGKEEWDSSTDMFGKNACGF